MSFPTWLAAFVGALLLYLSSRRPIHRESFAGIGLARTVVPVVIMGIATFISVLVVVLVSGLTSEFFALWLYSWFAAAAIAWFYVGLFSVLGFLAVPVGLPLALLPGDRGGGPCAAWRGAGLAVLDQRRVARPRDSQRLPRHCHRRTGRRGSNPGGLSFPPCRTRSDLGRHRGPCVSLATQCGEQNPLLVMIGASGVGAHVSLRLGLRNSASRRTALARGCRRTGRPCLSSSHSPA